MNSTLSQPGTSTAPPGGQQPQFLGRGLLAGLVLPVVTLAVVVAGLQGGAGPLPAVTAVAFGLVLTAAASGALGARGAGADAAVAGGLRLAGRRSRAARSGLAAPIGASGAERSVLRAAVDDRRAAGHRDLVPSDAGAARRPPRRPARVGWRRGPPTRWRAARAWPWPWPGRPLPAAAVAVAWSLALACALPAARLRYLAAAGRDRERMQWIATGTVLAADTALVAAVLNVLVSWPTAVGAVTAACALFLPLGMLAGGLRGAGPQRRPGAGAGGLGRPASRSWSPRSTW